MTTKPRLLLVGFRRNALAAAKKCGFDVILWDHRQPPTLFKQQFIAIITEDFPDIDDTISHELIATMKTLELQHIIATTEKSVLPAARLGRLLGLAGIDPLTALNCRDKLHMKLCAMRANIPITQFELTTPNTNADDLIAKLHLPLFLKERALSGGRGLLWIDTQEKLQQALRSNYLAEQFIDGIEMSVESFVKNGEVIFHNITEYYEQYSINIVPAQLTSELRQRIIIFNQQIIKAMGVQTGMTHIEIFVRDNKFVFGEIALRPPGGYIMELLQHSYGFNAWEQFIKLMIGQSVNFARMQTPQYSAAWIIHPGEGTVADLTGWEDIKLLPTVMETHSKIKTGSVILMRGGSGDYCAHVIFRAPTREQIAQDLQQAKNLLNITFDKTTLT
jgi:biotin carboxylase